MTSFRIIPSDHTGPSGEEPSILVLAGSHAYGTSHPKSDVDIRGVFFEDSTAVLGMQGLRGHHTNGPFEDTLIYEAGKFFKLAAQANPNILEILFHPEPAYLDAYGEAIFAARSDFVGADHVRRAYSGFAIGQMRRARSHSGARLYKHRLHSLRVLDAAIELLATGILPVRVGDVETLRAQSRLDEEAFEKLVEDRVARIGSMDTILPPRPDRERLDRVLVELRIAALSRDDLI